MTTLHISQNGRASEAGLAVLAGLFSATLFLSAGLLFSIQPMFTKMVLPVPGGSPGVWSIAMVFFQALLLAGYVYAHLLTRYLPLRMAALMHLALNGLAIASLPVSAAAAQGGPPEQGQALWLISVFALATRLQTHKL